MKRLVIFVMLGAFVSISNRSAIGGWTVMESRTTCDDKPYVFNPLPAADGHYYEYDYYSCYRFGPCSGDSGSGTGEGIRVYQNNWSNDYERHYGHAFGIMEFDLSHVEGLSRDHTEADLSLTVKAGSLSDYRCLYIYGIRDEHENGVIETADTDIEVLIESICGPLQPGDAITIDVTASIVHDLFDPVQTGYAGFVIDIDAVSDWYGDEGIEFYDHTDPVNGPRLTVALTESDSDDIPDHVDNCPLLYNPLQEDTYPPQGNGIGDACDCEGDFMCDGDVDGSDASMFKFHFGRSSAHYQCTALDPCRGDFSCDGDVDGTDASLFKSDFGRSSLQNPCPACVAGEWCAY